MSQPGDVQWNDRYRTPPVSPERDMPMSVCTTPSAVGRRQPNTLPPPPASPCITRQASYLTLKGAPQSPRALLSRRRAHEPSGLSAHGVRRSNINPFTPVAERSLMPTPLKRWAPANNN